MKTYFAVVATSLALAFTAGATDFPKYETFLGYNFVRFNPDLNFGPSFNANGGSGQFVYNFSKWGGVAVEAGASTKGVLNGLNVDTTVAHVMAGPRFTFMRHSKFMPYGEALFGGAYSTSSMKISAIPAAAPVAVANPTPISVRIQASNTGFALMAGGGLDYKFSKHVAFRPFGADYYLTRMPTFANGGNDQNRNNWRLLAGFNFLFGER
jgi:outer membrane protein with beta-barrel domain